MLFDLIIIILLVLLFLNHVKEMLLLMVYADRETHLKLINNFFFRKLDHRIRTRSVNVVDVIALTKMMASSGHLADVKVV